MEKKNNNEIMAPYGNRELIDNNFRRNFRNREWNCQKGREDKWNAIIVEGKRYSIDKIYTPAF